MTHYPTGEARRSVPTRESHNAAEVNTALNGTQPDGRGMPRPYGYDWARGHRPLPLLPVQHHHFLHADVFGEHLGEDIFAGHQQGNCGDRHLRSEPDGLC